MATTSVSGGRVAEPLRLAGERHGKDDLIGAPDPPSSLGAIFDLAKLEFEMQLRLAERYDVKIRNTLGLATLVFGVAQTGVARSIAGSHHAGRILVVALAFVSLVALAIALGLAVRALWPSETQQMKGQWLTAELNKISDNEATHFGVVNELTLLVAKRQEDNKTRAQRMRCCQGASIAAVSVVCVQLVVQLVVAV